MRSKKGNLIPILLCSFQGMDLETPTPLYDEDDSVPLDDFMPKFSGDGWELMLRHPIKKKSFMAERYWKPCYVRMNGNTLYVYNAKTDPKPIHVSFFQHFHHH